AMHIGIGDGTLSYEKSPMHQYMEPGRYVVCAIFESPNGNCKADICKEVVIGALDCYANYKYIVDPDDYSVKFFADVDSSVKVSWDFGDNNFNDGSKEPVHKFKEPGVYRVCLNVL
ncbi:MAG: hypothetical protein HC896_08370, partial [Bacteroidales bacterium]|nr:hypothetical protein [Bacteroidales bacterium]